MEKRELILFIVLLVGLFTFVGCAPKEPITSFAVYDGRSLGPENASVKIYLFTDYDCPYCLKEESVVYDLVKKYGNQIRLEHRDFIIHPESYLAAEASQCAADQNKFWDYNKVLFDNQGDFFITDLNKYARNLELNEIQFGLCLLEHQKKSSVEKDIEEGTNYGVEGTPTMVINDQVFVGYRSVDDYSKIIDEELKK